MSYTYQLGDSQTKGRLPIGAEGITVASAIAAIASIHSISQARYRIAVYDQDTKRLFSNPTELLTNGCQVYLKVETRRLDVDAPEAAFPDSFPTRSNEYEWGETAATPEWGAVSNPLVTRGPSPAKLLVIASHSFPMGLASSRSSHCPLCRECPAQDSSNHSSPIGSTSYLECCGYTCCTECLHYATSSLFTNAAICLVCGVTRSNFLCAKSDACVSLVKRERAEAPCSDRGGDMPVSQSCSDRGLDSDDDFGSFEPLPL